MKYSARLRQGVCAGLTAALLTFGAAGTRAVTNTWTGLGSDNFWMTASNWNNNILPGAFNDLVFPSGAARTSNTNNFVGGVSFNSIAFSGAYTLRGSDILLLAGIRATHASGIVDVRLRIPLGGNQTFSNSQAATLRFSEKPIELNGNDLTFGAVGEIVQTAGSTIIGDGSVIKTGSGNLYLGSQTSNSYTGTTEVRQGTLVVQSGGALGTTNGNTMVFAGATLAPNGTFTSQEPLVLQGTFSIGTFSFGTNIWTGPVTLMATNVTVMTQGGGRADFYGVVSGNGGLNKTGLGTLVLNAANTYTGETANSAGLLLINGHQPHSPITFTGGTLGGTGTVGTVTATGVSSKTFAPGASVGILTCSNVTLNANTTFAVELNGTTPGSGHDQLNVTGTVNLGGSILSVVQGFTPVIGDAFTIVNNDGSDAVIGTFNGLPQGAVFTNSAAQFSISYTGGDGNDVVIYRGLPSVRLTGITPLANGVKQIQGLGLSNSTYTIEAATNLTPTITWSNLGNALATNGGVFSFTDTNAPLFPIRFYRAVSP